MALYENIQSQISGIKRNPQNRKSLRARLELDYVEASGNASTDNTFVYQMYEIAKSSLSKEDKRDFIKRLAGKTSEPNSAERLFADKAIAYSENSKTADTVKNNDQKLVKKLNIERARDSLDSYYFGALSALKGKTDLIEEVYAAATGSFNSGFKFVSINSSVRRRTNRALSVAEEYVIDKARAYVELSKTNKIVKVKKEDLIALQEFKERLATKITEDEVVFKQQNYPVYSGIKKTNTELSSVQQPGGLEQKVISSNSAELSDPHLPNTNKDKLGKKFLTNIVNPLLDGITGAYNFTSDWISKLPAKTKRSVAFGSALALTLAVGGYHFRDDLESSWSNGKRLVLFALSEAI